MNKKTIGVLSLIGTIATSAYAYKNKKEIKKCLFDTKEFLKEKINEIRTQGNLISEEEKQAVLSGLDNFKEDLTKFFNGEKTSSNFRIFDGNGKQVLSLTDFFKSKK